MSAGGVAIKKRTRKPAWFRRIPAEDRLAIAGIVKWLRPVPWQWFVTLTFPWNVREETAVKRLRQFVNGLEKFARANVCFIAGRETRIALNGLNVPHHFHLLLTCRGTLTKEAISVLWQALVARRDADLERKDCIRVEPYDPDAPGAEYCLKGLNDDHGDWITHRLEYFLPDAPGPSRPTHAKVRSAKRAKLQAQRP